jgi:hypothetical protein
MIKKPLEQLFIFCNIYMKKLLDWTPEIQFLSSKWTWEKLEIPKLDPMYILDAHRENNDIWLSWYRSESDIEYIPYTRDTIYILNRHTPAQITLWEESNTIEDLDTSQFIIDIWKWRIKLMKKEQLSEILPNRATARYDWANR